MSTTMPTKTTEPTPTYKRLTADQRSELWEIYRKATKPHAWGVGEDCIIYDCSEDTRLGYFWGRIPNLPEPKREPGEEPEKRKIKIGYFWGTKTKPEQDWNNAHLAVAAVAALPHLLTQIATLEKELAASKQPR